MLKVKKLNIKREADSQKAKKDDVGTVGISQDSFARVVAFVINPPEDVDINEIIFRPTA